MHFYGTQIRLKTAKISFSLYLYAISVSNQSYLSVMEKRRKRMEGFSDRTHLK